MKPLCVDLFAGRFGWSQGWLEMGGCVVGFDLEHEPHHGPVPHGADLVLQDVRTIDGARFKDASLILSSSPCQEFSYRAMPWKRAKALGPPLLGLELFAQAFRIQREAIEASTCWKCEDWHITAYCEACKGTRRRFIPMVQENVRGANPWVRAEFGRSRWSYGSFHLWGDVPALMPIALRVPPKCAMDDLKYGQRSLAHAHLPVGDGPMGRNDGKEGRKEGRKNSGGSWFNVAHNTGSGKGRNPDGRLDGVKQPGIGGERANGKGDRWFQDGAAALGSKSSARKAASARIAKIPETLARHIARTYFPR